jgi:hypothetical protein
VPMEVLRSALEFIVLSTWMRTVRRGEGAGEAMWRGGGRWRSHLPREVVLVVSGSGKLENAAETIGPHIIRCRSKFSVQNHFHKFNRDQCKRSCIVGFCWSYKFDRRQGRW